MKLFNAKGDLFATIICFFWGAVLKLGSSLILTRILLPDAYGIITILMSITFVIELLGDINVTLFIVRDKNGEEPRYLHTAWTLRLGRAVLNSVIILFGAPLLASSLYHVPALLSPLRLYSLWFLLAGLETMAFPIAIRRKQSRFFSYSELATSVVGTVFSVTYCYYSRDYWGMIYGTLLGRAVMTLLSYCFLREFRPRLQFDRVAAREILGFTKFTMPSSLLTLALNQFDKVAFLRLFDLKLLGVYGLAANMASPIEGLIARVSQLVLYPRCAHNFRTDRDNFTLNYYRENVKLFVGMLFIPAAAGGAAHLVIGLLYPDRYALAGSVLQALMLRAAFLALASPAEDLLIAAGEYHVILFGNILRAIGIVAASLAGYYVFGFMGFIYGIALSGLPPLLYYLGLQKARGIMIVRYELYKVAFLVSIAMSSFFVSHILSGLLPRKF